MVTLIKEVQGAGGINGDEGDWGRGTQHRIWPIAVADSSSRQKIGRLLN